MDEEDLEVIRQATNAWEREALEPTFSCQLTGSPTAVASRIHGYAAHRWSSRPQLSNTKRILEYD